MAPFSNAPVWDEASRMNEGGWAAQLVNIDRYLSGSATGPA